MSPDINRMLRVCSALVLLAFALPGYAAVDGPVRVIDGDTLDVGGVRVRLHGVDAPEIGQTCQTSQGETWECGIWVSREMRAQYQGSRARCTPVDKDRYGRVVAICRIGGVDIGRALVRRGMAIAFRKYSDGYVADERRAKRAGVGLHAGKFQRPSAYRKARAAHADARGASCRIKGNISRSGTRIYHLPGQRFYASTTIRRDQGERWFCSEAAARSAGWRKARR